MSLIDSLTPKNTEEIKPGLFIQKTPRGYRQINPMAWNGEFRTKEQLRTIINFKSIFTIALILFIAYHYSVNTTTCEEFQKNPCPHLPAYIDFCSIGEDPKYGNENFLENLNYDVSTDTNSLQGYP